MIMLCFVIVIIFIKFWPKEVIQCSVSRAYPSYGLGCNIKCQNEYEYSSLTFYKVTTNWSTELEMNMYKATDILTTFGKPESLAVNESSWLHVVLHYYCCYSKEELMNIKHFLNNYKWITQEIVFDKMVCTITDIDKISIVLMANQKSQYNLLKLTNELENDMKSKMNIPIRISRSKLEKIHMPLGVVSRLTFPALHAVNEINKQIPPNTWHNQTILLKKPPICKRCNNLVMQST